jgi:hypothetical protein
MVPVLIQVLTNVDFFTRGLRTPLAGRFVVGGFIMAGGS